MSLENVNYLRRVFLVETLLPLSRVYFLPTAVANAWKGWPGSLERDLTSMPQLNAAWQTAPIPFRKSCLVWFV